MEPWSVIAWLLVAILVLIVVLIFVIGVILIIGMIRGIRIRMKKAAADKAENKKII